MTRRVSQLREAEGSVRPPLGFGDNDLGFDLFWEVSSCHTVSFFYSLDSAHVADI